MRRELGRGMVRVEDFDDIAARGRDRTAIADLAAGFAVERCLGGEQLDLISFDRFVCGRRRYRKWPARRILLRADHSR